jgi:hypothetical protein
MILLFLLIIQMKELWQGLDNFSPISNNNYVDNCNDVTMMREYKECDQMIRLLKGLSEQYTVVRAQIMLMDPFPNIAKVFSANQSYVRGSSSRGRGDIGGRSYGSRGRGIKICSQSSKTGHTPQAPIRQTFDLKPNII